MNRHLRIFDLALSTLLRSRTKTAVIIVVYSSLVGVLASLLLLAAALRREAHLLLETAPEIVVQRLSGGRHELMPVDRVASLAEIRGVGAVTPRVWGYSYDPPTKATLTFWGADSIPAAALELVDGAYPGDGDGVEILVGQGVAEARFLGPGDRLPMKRDDGTLFAPRVGGIFTVESALLTNDLVVMPTSELRRVFGLGEELCTDLAVEVVNPREVGTVARKIEEMWPDVRTVSRRQILQTYDAVFDWRSGVWAAALIGAIAAFAILVWNQATGLSAEEQRTVGVLKAVGWSPRDVLELKLWEGIIVSLVSVTTGLLAAEVHLIRFDGALFAPVLKGWSVLFPTFEVVPVLDSYALLLCLLLAVGPYVAATLVPSWRAAITDPDTVMRG